MDHTQTAGASFHVQNSRGLTSLPFEVLSQILTLVNGSDTPTLKLTCKTIYSVIKTRQFWYNRIHQLCEEHLVSPPEEEMEEYTIAELAQWTMRRTTVRSGVSTTSKIRHLRDFNLRIKPTGEHTLLIPGGRWLLVTYGQDPLAVYFFDLESRDLKPHLLLDPRDIDPRIKDCTMNQSGHYVWIDHDASRLSFRFAGHISDPKSGPCLFRAFIYQINLIGHGASATLVAQIIATFQSPAEPVVFTSCTFNSRYFIRSTTTGLEYKLEIFDYRQALGCFVSPLIDRYTVPLKDLPYDIKFIIKDILAVQCLDEAFYQIFNIESPTSIKLLHDICKSLPIDLYSTTRRTHGVSLMTLIKLKERSIRPYDQVPALQGLVIPHDSSIHPRIIELGKLTRWAGAHLRLGIFISLLFDRTSDHISYIRHEWDYTSSTSSDQFHTILTLNLPHDFREFDEDTGRSVYSDEGLHIVYIVPRAH